MVEHPAPGFSSGHDLSFLRLSPRWDRTQQGDFHAPRARRGIRSRVSRIVPWAKGRHQTAAPPRDPDLRFFDDCPVRHVASWTILRPMTEKELR